MFHYIYPFASKNLKNGTVYGKKKIHIFKTNIYSLSSQIKIDLDSTWNGTNIFLVNTDISYLSILSALISSQYVMHI